MNYMKCQPVWVKEGNAERYAAILMYPHHWNSSWWSRIIKTDEKIVVHECFIQGEMSNRQYIRVLSTLPMEEQLKILRTV